MKKHAGSAKAKDAKGNKITPQQKRENDAKALQEKIDRKKAQKAAAGGKS